MNSTGQGERIIRRTYGTSAEAGLVLATQRE